jgi:methionyl-tRNA formyltransferase
MDRVILLGEGPTAASAFEALAAQFEVCAVFRRRLDANDPVAELAARHSVPLIAQTTISRIDFEIRRFRPACVVISSYDRLIPPGLLELAPFINVHYGPLPRYRGRANVNWAILNHESEAAITIHTVEAGLDSGNILFQSLIPIGEDATVTELYAELNKIQRSELGRAVARRLAGYAGEAQQGAATYCCSRVPGDGEIDWTAAVRDVYAQVRALAPPYPGAHTYFRLQRIIVLKAAPVLNALEYVGRVPGRVCAIHAEPGAVDVLTGDGVLRIYEVENADGVRMQAAQLIRSIKDTLGLAKRDLLQRIQVLEQELALLKDEPHRQSVYTNVRNDALMRD